MEVWVDGIPLTDIGAYGAVKYTENLRRGCDTCTWQMNPRFRDSRVRAGASVVVKDAPTNLWSGVLGEPGRNGDFTAYGHASEGDGVDAIDGVGAATMTPETAIQAAITRGAVRWLARGYAFGGTVPGDVDPSLSLTQLLDQHSDYTGFEWRVDHNGKITDLLPATSPSWAVQVGATDLWSYDDSNMVTHLNVEYLATGPAFAKTQVTTSASAAAAAKWRRVEKKLDLTGLGILTLGEATTMGQQLLAKTGPRLQLVESITVAPGQLRNLGDTPAGWTSVHPGQMLRLWGVPDKSQTISTLHTDVVIGRIERDRSTLTMTPRGSESQTYEDYVAEMFAAAAA